MKERETGGRAAYAAVLAGATGLVGMALLRQLLEDRSCRQLTVIARRDCPEPALLDAAKLRWITAELDHLESALEQVSVDVVYCTLGTTIKKAGSQEVFAQIDRDYPLRLAQWAKSSGARAFLVVSSMGAAERSMFFYSRVKGEMETKAEAVGLPELHIFQPSLLLGERRDDHRSGEKAAEAVAGRVSWLWRGPLRRYAPIPGAEVARAMRAVAGEAVRRSAAVDQAAAGSPAVRRYASHEIADLARRHHEQEEQQHAD